MGRLIGGVFISLPAIVIAIIMEATVLRAKKGSIVTMNTIKGVGLAGIIISAIMIMIAFGCSIYWIPIFVGIPLLVASILYRLSIKNIKLAKIGAILAWVVTLFIIYLSICILIELF